MTITAAQKTRYTTEVDITWRDALAIYHPSAGWKFIVDHHAEIEANFQGATRLFSPAPFQLNPPSSSSSGRQEMGLVIDISEPDNPGADQPIEAIEFLEAAMADSDSQITAYWTQYVLGSSDPQWDPPWNVDLTNIVVDAKGGLTATATTADVLNRPFPNVRYTVEEFPALRRK